MLGKLAFATVSGGLIDVYGMRYTYALFVLLAAVPLPIIAYLPDTYSDKDKEKSEDGHVEKVKNM